MAETYCSFCGKAEHEVFYIVRGPAAGICDECVVLSGDVVQKQRGRVARGEKISRERMEPRP
jgi:ATP-dependent protease Clp ATPase subunit